MKVLIFSYLRSCRWRDKSISVWRFFITFICLLWFGTLVVRATDRYVATNGTDSGTCESWETAASNIQYAVNLAIAPNDTVWVSNGTYCVTNQIMITNNITVRSANGWTNTIVFADFPAWTNTRCFYVSRTGTVDGFMITNGHYMASANYGGGGGALLATGTIQNCYFTRNVSSNSGANYAGGGGVYINNGTVSNCTFVANVVYTTVSDISGGGAIFMYQNAIVIGCHIASNATTTGGRGGGIQMAEFTPMLISNCTFNANAAGDSSQAVYLMSTNSTVTDCVITNHLSGVSTIYSFGKLRNCVIANNKSSQGPALLGGSATNCIIANNESSDFYSWKIGGGALGSFDGCIVSNNICRGGPGGGGVIGGLVRNCLIHHNTNMSAAGNGGGVYITNVANSPGKGIYNCTIVNNYSLNGGGGLAAFGTNNYIVNSIIAGNNAYSNTYAEIYNAGENTNNYWYCCANVTSAPLAVGQGNITNDPAFSGASAGNWRLNANSPCINTGTNQTWMTNYYDLDRRTRIRYGAVDMGAYERINEGTIYKLW